MGWERRGNRTYYYTALRVGDRVFKLYVGNGQSAAIADQLISAARDERDDDADIKRHERNELAALDAALTPLNELADAATAAALVAAGFHRHKRGKWRKRRG